MKTNRKGVIILLLGGLLLAMLLLMLIMPVVAVGDDYGIQTGSTPGGPTPHLSVWPSDPTDTPPPPTATATPDN